MKKLIFLTMAIGAVITTSCNKDKIEDFTKLENLSGTTWKSTSGPLEDYTEYVLLIFTSTSTVEGWTKAPNKGEKKDWTGTFTLSNDRISITYGSELFTGIIEGNTLTTTFDGEEFIFTKQ